METVKAIYEGANKQSFSIGPQQTVHFLPGTNEIPKADWDKLIGSASPGGLQHFLNNRKIKIIGAEAENPDDPPPKDVSDVGKMNVGDAIEAVQNTFSADQLEKVRESEQSRSAPRKSVMTAIAEQQKQFDEFDAAKADGEKDQNSSGE